MSLVPRSLRADPPRASYYSSAEQISYSVEVSVSEAWGSYYNLQFAITNSGRESIHNWFLTFDLPYRVEGVWNAILFETDGSGVYTFKNAGWNQDILEGQTVFFGMTVSLANAQNATILPSFYLLNTRTALVDPSSYSLTYQEYSNWGSGFNGGLIISNLSTESIEDWTLTFDSNREITEVSGATFSKSDGSYTISNCDFNQNITGSCPINMTINGSGYNTNYDLLIQNVSLYSVIPAFSLFDDIDGNNIPDYLDYIYSSGGSSEISPTPSATPTVNPTATPVATDTPTPPTPSETEESFTDSDNDGLLDNQEEMYGTNPLDSDTDNDGITDFVEITMGYNPVISDTDGNGISDGLDDFDCEGLSNAEELERGTCPYLSDSDDDGINDYDEIFVYRTDPRKPDSDEDGISDGDELQLHKNPSDPSDKNELILQTKTEVLESVISSVTVTMEMSNLIDSTLIIEDLNEKDLYTSELVGRVGNPLSFECYEEFETASLVINYDENNLGDVLEENLAVLWFDEEHGVYIVQDQAILDTTNNSITLELNHFSTYVLIDKTIWNSVNSVEYSFSSVDLNFDYYVAINVSSGMSTDARNNAITVVKDLISTMNENDRICVIYFGTTDKTYAQLIYKKDTSGINQVISEVEYYVMNFDLGQYGSYRWAFSAAAGVIRKFPSDVGNKKALLILSNDDDMIHSENYVSDMIAYQTSADFTAGFVMLQDGNEGPYDYGWKYALETGSQYFKYPTLSNLNYTFTTNFSYSLAWNIDSDWDGIPDFAEIQGICGTNGKVYYSNPNNSDSDGDTIPDNEEFDVIYELMRFGDGRFIEIRIDGITVYSSDTGNIESSSQYAFLEGYISKVGPGKRALYGVVSSDPQIPDSDYDGINDAEDARPTTVNHDMIYILAGPDPNFVDQGMALEREYKKAGLSVTRYNFTNSTDFIAYWDSLGWHDLNGSSKYGDKYYYNVSNVVIAHHGSHECIVLNDSQLLLMGQSSNQNNISVSQLSNKRIRSLNLYACSCGEKNVVHPSNIAEAFLHEHSNIEQVVAFDTTICGTATHNGDSYAYFGWTYESLYELDEDDFNWQIDTYSHNGIVLESNSNSTLLLDNQSIKGFRCFKRNDHGVYNFAFYPDNIRFGVLYSCVFVNSSDNQQEKKYFFWYNDLYNYDFDVTHDPLLSGY